MGLFNFLKGKKIDIQPVQMAENGGLDLDATLKLAQRQPKTPFERLFGRNIEIDTDTQNPKTNEITTERVVKFQPGMLNDIASGAKENYTTGFAASNLQDKIGTEGQNKGLAYRIGEGAGTLGRGLKQGTGALGRGLKQGTGALGRGLKQGTGALGRGLKRVGQFVDTPLGRAVIMGGLVGATGGSGLEMLAYGSSAGLLNQQNRTQDELYRRDLESQGIDTSNIRGYIGKETYQNLINSKIAQENAAYRRMYYDTQNVTQQEMMDLRRREAERQARKDERDYNLDRERVGLQARGLDLEEQKLNQNKKAGGIANLQAVSQQLQRFEDSFKNMPNKLESNTLGRLRNFTGLQTQTEANFNSQRQLLFNKIARDLGGEKGVLSDQDIKRIEGALPSYTDSYAQKQAKMQAIYDLLNDRLSVEGGSLYNNPQPTQGGTTQVGKYKVRVK